MVETPPFTVVQIISFGRGVIFSKTEQFIA